MKNRNQISILSSTIRESNCSQHALHLRWSINRLRICVLVADTSQKSRIRVSLCQVCTDITKRDSQPPKRPKGAQIKENSDAFPTVGHKKVANLFHFIALIGPTNVLMPYPHHSIVPLSSLIPLLP